MVLVSPITSGPNKHLLQTLITLGLNKIEIIPSGSSSLVIVNSKRIELPVAGKAVEITGIIENKDDEVIATLRRTTDGVVVINARNFFLEEVATNGKELQIMPSPFMHGKVSGLCGSFHGDTVTGSLSCVYSKPELEVASWTVPMVGSGSVSGSVSIPAPLMSELKRESQQCAKVTLNPTKVSVRTFN